MLRGEIVIRYPDDTLPDVDGVLAGVADVERHAILDLAWGGDGALTQLYHVTGDNIEGIERAFDAHDCVHDWEIATVGHGGSERDLYILVHGRTGDVVEPLYAFADDEPILVEPPIYCEEASWRFALVGTDEAIQRAHAVGREHADIDVEGLQRFTPDRPSELGALTDRQREALETAVAIGFYDEEGGVSFDALADALDCGRSAANALLRRAEARLVTRIVEG